MWKKIKSLLGSTRSSDLTAKTEPVKAPMDLNIAIENPSLVMAMERVALENSDASKDALLLELQKANYLAAMFTEGLVTTESNPGEITIEKGSTFGVLSASKDDKNYLVLFTDWGAIRKYTERQVSGWVLPARDAWSFALQGTTYDGVVINPAHNALPLEKPMLNFLLKNVPQ